MRRRSEWTRSHRGRDPGWFRDALARAGAEEIVELMFATHAGMTDETFERIVCDWLAKASHPKFGSALSRRRAARR